MSNVCLVCKMKNQSKSRLEKLIPEHLKYCEKVDELYLLKFKLTLLKQLYNERKKRIEEVNNESRILTRSNNGRDDRLTRVRQRDYSNKYKIAENNSVVIGSFCCEQCPIIISECLKKKLQLNKDLSQLQNTRRSIINTFADNIFHMKTPTIDSSIAPVRTTEPAIENEGRGLLDFEIIKTDLQSEGRQPVCITESSLSYIGHGFLPNSDQLTDYLQGNYKLIVEEEEHNQSDIDHLSDRSRGLSAALSLIIHCVVLLSTILDQSLPHPLILPIALCEYGKVDKSLSDVLCFLAKLDDIIMFLCFTQNIDHNELIIGNTIGNLHKLIGSKKLGRSGPFICYPELLRYPLMGLNKTHSTERASDWENEPPLLHIVQTPHIQSTDSSQTCDSSNNTTSDIDYYNNNNNNISEGWEEVHDMIVPSSNYYGSSSTISQERLMYGVSYSDYTLRQGQQLGDDPEQTNNNGRTSDRINSSAGLFDALGSMFGSSSGWIRKQ